MWKIVIPILMLAFWPTADSVNRVKVLRLTPGLIADGLSGKLTVFCYDGESESVIGVWKTAKLQLMVDSEKYRIYQALDSDAVIKQYEEESILLSWWPSITKSIPVKVFEKSCTGVWSDKNYQVHLVLRRIDYYWVATFIVGVCLFYMAPLLSRKQFFYYSSGITIGTLGSVLIALYMISRLTPKRVATYAVLSGGLSVYLYGLNLLWKNFSVVLNQYHTYIFAYLLLSGLLSFAIIYYVGPVRNPRTRNLIQWTLQSVGVILVFYSSELKHMTLLVVFGMLLENIIPSKWKGHFKHKMYHYWTKYVSVPRPVLLTEEEYNIQGLVETKKAIEELRVFCKSPNCDVWRLQRSLNNPTQFAEFVNGASHVSDQQLIQYSEAIGEGSASNSDSDGDSSDPMDQGER